MRMRPALGVALGCALMATAACARSGEEQAVDLPDDATVSYAYHDSSVPPQYHRSVTLTATRAQSRIIIDSYGDVLADQTVPTTPEAWTRLGATVSTVSGLRVEAPPDGCVGGTGIDLVVTSGDHPLVSLSPEFCGGSNESLVEPIQAWVAPIRGLFGPTDELAPGGE